jgi:UTP--glucose-1-phosphate uridylyltransferase
MRGFAGRVTFAVQRAAGRLRPRGFSDENFAGGEMVLLGLGDHLFRGRPVSPYRELAEMAAVSGGKSVSAVNRISAGELKGYGTIAGARRAGKPAAD